MKKIVLTLLIFLSTFSCKEDKEHLQKIITEEAMLYFYCDAGFATSQCNFVIETNNNEVFIPENNFDFTEFRGNNLCENTVNNVKVTYRLTGNLIDRCNHKAMFLENPTLVIKILALEKL